MIKLVPESVVLERLLQYAEHHGGVNRAGRTLGIGAKHISDMIRGKRSVSGEMLAILGFKRVLAFEEVPMREDKWTMEIVKRGKCRHRMNGNMSYYQIVACRDGRILYRLSRTEMLKEEFNRKYEVI